jgi:uncharacterized membrane protein
MQRLNLAKASYCIAVGSLTASIALCLLWELWLAPLRPGGSWLVLKTLPLLAPLFGILHARAYTYRWASMLLVAYFIEGCVRAYAESGLARILATSEIALSLAFIVAAVVFIRTAGQPQHARAKHS